MSVIDLEKGIVFVSKQEQEVTKENHNNRNIDFRHNVKILMNGLLHNENFRTLNLRTGKYLIQFNLAVIPAKEKKLIKVVQ